MYDPTLPLGYEDIPDAFAQWISNLASWDWFVTLTLRDLTTTKRTLRSQSARVLTGEPSGWEKTKVSSRIPLKNRSATRPGLRMRDVTGTDWNKPGKRYANHAWWDFLTASNRNSPIDDRKWVRVMEYHKSRGVPHIHALITETAGSPRRMEMVDWAWKHYGMARVLEYDPELGAAHYLGKYLLKDEAFGRDMLDIEFGGL